MKRLAAVLFAAMIIAGVGLVLTPKDANSWDYLRFLYQWKAFSTGAGGEEASFCSGTELFCEDFEGTDTTWVAGQAQVDCSAYDTSGDYCDDDTNSPQAGSECMGFYGNPSARLGKTLTSSTAECTLKFYYQTGDDVATTYFMRLYDEAGNSSIVSLQTSSTGLLRIVAGATTLTAATNALSTNTWYLITVYYKEETGSNDGIVKAKIGTTEVISSTTVDTGTTNIDGIRFYATKSSTLGRFDNVSIVDGNSY